MNHPIRQHYDPMCYLEGFTFKGKFWVYNLTDRSYKQLTPINTAVINNYYTVILDNGEKNYDVETLLAAIESKFKPILSKLDREELPTNEEFTYLVQFVAFQLVRVPRFIDLLRNSITSFTIKRLINGEYNHKVTDDNIIQEKITALGNGDSIANPNKIFSNSARLELVLLLQLVFDSLNWTILKAPKSSLFITSDNPVSILSSEGLVLTHFPKDGILAPKTQYIIPLSQHICLVMGDREDLSFRFINTTRENVRRINILSTMSSRRILIGKDKALLEHLIRRSKVHNWYKPSELFAK